MTTQPYEKLLADLRDEYRAYAPKSAAINARANKVQVDGGSHALRLIEPFPPRVAEAHGAWLTDEDGHEILDFWQGHLGNILGHNPPIITQTLKTALGHSAGLQTGFTDRLQAETAEILSAHTGAERVRFTTSGTLATMYAILLARAATGRDVVMKVGGGWHGAHPWGLKGVGYHARKQSYQYVETEGLPTPITDAVVVTRFNDADMLRDHFKQYGDQVACFIVEPFIGAGGFIPANQEYLQVARDLTEQYGAALIFDEVIAGFRFRAGDTGALYGIQPDMATFGKIIGGGMPVAAVAGKAAFMDLAGRAGGRRVSFSGGTYSGHPLSMLAAKTMLHYLVTHEKNVYPRLALLGDQTRKIIEAAFTETGILARCTGYGNEALPGSSMFMLHFPHKENQCLDTPESLFDPTGCRTALSGEILLLALLLEDVHLTHGHGALSTTHSEADLAIFEEACRKVAARFKAYLE